MNPLVSIIMLAYNEEKWIANSIESILDQTYKNIELIIIDDYCTDNSIKIALKYAGYDKRIRIFSKTTELQRAGISRNIGVKLSTGEYIAFQDADDTSDPDRIYKQMSKALEKPGKILTGCNVIIIGKHKTYIKKLPFYHKDIIKGFHKSFGRGNYFVMGSALGPKKFFINNPCKEILSYVEDWDQLLRIYENEEVEFYNIQEPLYHYNQIDGLSDYKNGWIDSNLFVRFSQRMRLGHYKDPNSNSELDEYLNNNFIEKFYYNILKKAYSIKSEL